MIRVSFRICEIPRFALSSFWGAGHASCRKRRKFTPEYKAEVVKLVRTSDKSIGQVSGELELTVRFWVKRAEIDEKQDPNGPLTSEEHAEVTRLRRELRTVTMERDFLRKAAAFVARSGK